MSEANVRICFSIFHFSWLVAIQIPKYHHNPELNNPNMSTTPATTTTKQIRTVQESWTILESWLKENWPEASKAINPPISFQDFENLEETLGYPVPDDLRESLFIHDGIDDFYTIATVGSTNPRTFNGHGGILHQWKIWDELLKNGLIEEKDDTEYDAGVQPDLWWSRKWIPITHDGSNDHHCLDLTPGEGGTEGQVISVWHDKDQRSLVSPGGFREFFSDYVQGLIDGTFVYSEKYGGVVDKSKIKR
ncbi:unnamed protein product [Ambrosiozyma monospora]|uniref:Unnamed protein product n=1 Tax=Ambrosiozyma monospora TaxID=43982 RepID=A0ACB5SWS1_AMBMO|nr:unnamed protein product [Ambrosiozyma monospora]